MSTDSSKFFTKLRLPAIAALALAAPQLTAQDAAPADPKQIIQALRQIKAQQHEAIKSDETKLAQQYMGLSSNAETALAYYKEAVLGTQFAGKPHDNKEFQEWEKKSKDRLKDADFRTALSLHLMYLSLTFSHDSGVKTKDLLPALLSYVDAVRANQGSLWDQDEFMKQPLSNSIFVRWLQISHYVDENANWEMTPINIGGIFDKVILPEYRRTGNAKGIFDYWDQRLAREGDQAAKSGRAFDLDKFNQSTKPEILFLRASEYVTLKQPNRAVAEMVSIIKAYPMHPNAATWISQVEGLIKVQEAAPAPVAAAPTPAAPVQTPPPEPVATPPNYNTTTVAPQPQDNAAAPSSQDNTAPPAQN